MAKKGTTRYYSNKQEKQIANDIGGKQVSNSGAVLFSAGDVLTKDFLIEAKTAIKPKNSFSIKKEWITKNNIERMSLGKPFGAIAFNFGGENATNYYVIDQNLFTKLVEYMERDDGL